MIKPATLWALFKTCDDSKWLGVICRALGRQDVNLDYGQKQIVKKVMLDSGLLDEAADAISDKNRMNYLMRKERSDVLNPLEREELKQLLCEKAEKRKDKRSDKKSPVPTVKQ